MAVNFLTGVLIARMIGVEGRGRLVTLQLWPIVIMTIFSGGFNAAIIHFTAKNLQEKPKSIGGIITISAIIGILVAFIGIPIALFGVKVIEEDRRTMVLTFLTVPLMVFAELTSGMMAGMGRFDIGNWTRLLRVSGSLIALVVLRLTHQISMPSVFWAMWLPTLSAIALNLYVFKKADLLHWGVPLQTIRLWLPYALAGGIGTLLQTTYLRLDQALMTIYMNNQQRGLYGNAVMLSEILLQVAAAMSTVIFTTTSLDEGSEESKLMSCTRIIRGGLITTLICGCAGILLLPHLLYWLYRPEFVRSADLFTLLLPGALAMTIAYPIQVFYQGINKPWVIVGPQIAAILTVLMGLFFALRAQSLEGVSLTASLGYIVYCLGMLFYIRRDYGTATLRSVFPSVQTFRTVWQRLQEILQRRSSLV